MKLRILLSALLLSTIPAVYSMESITRRLEEASQLEIETIAQKLEEANHLDDAKLETIFRYPAHMITLSEANQVIDLLKSRLESRLESLKKSDDRLKIRKKFDDRLKKISCFLAKPLRAVRGEELKEIVIKNVTFEDLFEPADYSLPWHKILKKYTEKILNPSDNYKRSLAVKVLNETYCNELKPCIADKQTWDDLEIFTGENSLSQNICRAETEIGKVFFWRQIASPTTERSVLQQQKELLNAIKESKVKESKVSDTILSLLRKLRRNESAVYGLWDSNDYHFDSLRFQKPRIFSDLPFIRLFPDVKKRFSETRIIGQLPDVKKNEDNLATNEVYQQAAQTRKVIDYLRTTLSNVCDLISVTGIVHVSTWGGFTKIMSALGAFDELFYKFITDEGRSELLDTFYLQAGLQLRLKHLAGYLETVKEIRKALVDSNSQLLRAYSESFDITQRSKELQELTTLLETPTFDTKKLEQPKDPKNRFYMVFSKFRGRVFAAAEKLIACRDNLKSLLVAVGKLDATMSIAKLLHDEADKYTLAEFDFDSDKPYVSLEKYWHPGIVTGDPVPNTLSIGGENPNNIVVSGPNKGGKSANTEIIPICCLLAQSIGVVPAKRFRATPFSTIQVFRNIKDDRGTGDSRFQAELKRAGALYKRAQGLTQNEFSLTYLDELYTGTAPLEGSIGSYVRVKMFGALPNAVTLTTTHYGIMKKLAEEKRDTFKNYKVTVRRENGQLVYPYELVEGFSSDCIAFDLAESLEDDPRFIRECRNLVEQFKLPQRQERFHDLSGRLDRTIFHQKLGIFPETLTDLLPLTRSSLDMVLEDKTHRDLTAEENEKLLGAFDTIFVRPERIPLQEGRVENTNHTAHYILGCLRCNYGVARLSPTSMTLALRRAILADDLSISAGAAYHLGKFFYELPEVDDTDYNDQKYVYARQLLRTASHMHDTDTWEGLASKLLLAKAYYEGKCEGTTQTLWELMHHVSKHSDINKTAAGEAFYYLGLKALQQDPSAARESFNKALGHTYSPEIMGLIRYELGLLTDNIDEKVDHFEKALELLVDEKKRDHCHLLLGDIYTNHPSRKNLDQALPHLDEIRRGDTEDAFFAEHLYGYNHQYNSNAVDANLRAAESYKRIVEAEHAPPFCRLSAHISLAGLYTVGGFGVNKNDEEAYKQCVNARELSSANELCGSLLCKYRGNDSVVHNLIRERIQNRNTAQEVIHKDITEDENLFGCVRREQSLCVQEILGHCPELMKKVDSRGRSLLHRALFDCARGEQSLCVQEILAHWPELMKKVDSRGRSFLHRAAYNGDYDLLKVLLQKDADVDKGDDYRSRTPLHYAVSELDLESVRLLFAANADPRVCDASGRTLLHEVVEAASKYYNRMYNKRKVEQIISLLMRSGAPSDVPLWHNGKTPMDVASEKNLTHVISALEEHERSLTLTKLEQVKHNIVSLKQLLCSDFLRVLPDFDECKGAKKYCFKNDLEKKESLSSEDRRALAIRLLDELRKEQPSIDDLLMKDEIQLEAHTFMLKRIAETVTIEDDSVLSKETQLSIYKVSLDVWMNWMKMHCTLFGRLSSEDWELFRAVYPLFSHFYSITTCVIPVSRMLLWRHSLRDYESSVLWAERYARTLHTNLGKLLSKEVRDSLLDPQRVELNFGEQLKEIIATKCLQAKKNVKV